MRIRAHFLNDDIAVNNLNLIVAAGIVIKILLIVQPFSLVHGGPANWLQLWNPAC